MKAINKRAQSTFDKLVGLLGTEDHAKVNNDETFMALSVHKLYDWETPHGSFPVYSLAHFYKQNGDLMRDPDMEFVVIHGRAYPTYFRQDPYTSQESVIFEPDGKYRVARRMQADHAVFAGKWLSNIKKQQRL